MARDRKPLIQSADTLRTPDVFSNVLARDRTQRGRLPEGQQYGNAGIQEARDLGAPTTKLTFELTAELHKKFKVRAALEDRSQREIVEQLIAEYLDGFEAKP